MSEESAVPQAPRIPRAAREVFGDSLPSIKRYAEILVDTGASHGLIGPRETPRVWDRHLLNCGIVETVLPYRTRLIDVGTGAGLPGLVLAMTRPDLQVHLVEPMLRRVKWLEGVVSELGVKNVTIHRGRAQDLTGALKAPVVTARAVARLGELTAWCAPLIEGDGVLLALKGETVAEEVERDKAEIIRFGGRGVRVLTVGEEILKTPTRIAEVRFGSGSGAAGPESGQGATVGDGS